MKRFYFVAILFGALGGMLTASIAYATRNASGTYSLPSGNPVVTGTTISSTTHNNTMSDIASEMTDSLSRSGKGGMSAPLQLSNGTVSLPSLTFGSDTDTGLYRIGANNPGFTVNGVKVQEWTTSYGAKFFGNAQVGALGTGGTNFAGLRGDGTGTAPGVYGQGAGAAKAGVEGVGDAAAASYGLMGTGYTTGAGVNAVNASAATADDNDSPALLVGTGHVKFASSNPATTTGFSNYQTPRNLIKAWGRVSIANASGTRTVDDGFNITSYAATSPYLTVNLATGVTATANFSMIVNGQDTSGLRPYACVGIPQSATQARVYCRNTVDTSIDLSAPATDSIIYFAVLGAQ